MATRSRKTAKGDRTPGMGGEFRSGPIAGTALISGATFAGKGASYADVDGLAIFEGDIVLGTVEDLRAAADGVAGMVQFSIGITGQQFRWPNNTVPFDIDPAMPNQQRITDAIAHWQTRTHMRFVLRTPANAAQFPDFVHFQSGGGCSSMVGRQGGRQNITLGNGCSTGNAIHEIGHSIGLWHEQSREDRNAFVRIVFANIDPAMQHNFLQHITDGDDLGPYDYGSIMHYPPNAFSINGQPTIIPLQPLPPGVVMGQRTALSQGDINGVHTMYPGGGPTAKEVAKDPITDTTTKQLPKDPIRETVKEVRKDPIRDTLKEVRKDPIRETVKEVRKDPIQDTAKEAIRDTIKEGLKDPIQDTLIERTGVPGRFGPPFGEPSPFILATPSRAGAGTGDAVADFTAQVQQLGEALVQLEQEQAELLAAYDEAVQTLDALQQGQG